MEKQNEPTDSFDMWWKFEAVKLAALEQLNSSHVLNTKKLFKRAEIIYDMGYEGKIDKWKSIWNDEVLEEEDNSLKGTAAVEFVKEMKKTEARKPNKTEKKIIELIKDPQEGFKFCACGEEVRSGWKEHKFKSDGTPCGHKFKEDKE